MKLLSKYFICSRQSSVKSIQLLISLSSSYFSSHLTCASHRFGNHLSSQWRMEIPRMCLLGNLLIISKILSNYIKPLIILIFIKKMIPCITGHWKLKKKKHRKKSVNIQDELLYKFSVSLPLIRRNNQFGRYAKILAPNFIYISGKFNFSLVGGTLLHTSLTIMQSINISVL